MAKFFVLLWLVLLGLVISYFVFTYGFLPDSIAVHFDLSGRPNGFQEKGSYGITFPLFVLAENGLLVLAGLFLGRIPGEWIHIPWKGYWFSSPELREEAFRKIKSVLFLAAAFSNTAFLFAVQVIYQENVQEPFFKIPLNGGAAFLLTGSAFFLLAVFYLLKPRPEGDRPLS